MDIKGVLLGIRSYSFPDEKTGNIIQGGKLFLAVPAATDGNTVGHEVSEIPYTYEKHNTLAQKAMQFSLKTVLVSCDATFSGKRIKMQVADIKPA